jgi:hypothetical protein
MPTPVVGTIHFRAVIIQPGSQAILALESEGRYCLPPITIAQGTRPAHQLQREIRTAWGLNVFVLDILTDGDARLVGAELLTPGMSSELKAVMLDQIASCELPEKERQERDLLLAGLHRHPCSCVGWIEEAIGWTESATGRTFSSKKHMEQFNAGGGFALLRLRSNDGCCYWIKATGEPNRHELSITSCLSALCPDFLPTLVATKKEWNAWLTEDAGYPLRDPSPDLLVNGARSFALLQQQTPESIDRLLAAGAFDQRLSVLRNHIDEVIDYLIDAMARQTSTKVAPLGRERLCDMGEILREACFRLQDIHIPDTLIHNDLNPGNILYDGTRYVFTDWSEAAVGNPFFSLARFIQLNVDAAADLRRVYRQCWLGNLSEEAIDSACDLAPLMAIYAYLYGRGDWLKDPSANPPQFESYARGLARHMDRAVKDPLLLETLCR